MTNLMGRAAAAVSRRVEAAIVGFVGAVATAIEAAFIAGYVVVVAALAVGVPLVGLYVLVRFVKWAWTE